MCDGSFLASCSQPGQQVGVWSRAPRRHTVLVQVQEALLLQEALDIHLPTLVLYNPLLCDDALDQG